MTFLLSSQNVFHYLVECGVCIEQEQSVVGVDLLEAKNFNLLVTLSDNRKLLVKQERHTPSGETSGEFLGEWRIHEFLAQSPEIGHLRSWLPIVLHFDEKHSVLVFEYLDEYEDLMKFYAVNKLFPLEVTSQLGKNLASLHRATFNCEAYQSFFSAAAAGSKFSSGGLKSILGLGQVGPEIFGLVPMDGLKFVALYQRYDSLGQAINDLSLSLKPCCLTHNDLKLNNILLHHNWQQEEAGRVRLIDWERCSWGDPVIDLGTLIASYLQLWLGSLVVSTEISLEESLRLAEIPLESLQPSIARLITSYVEWFPEIMEHRSDFLQRTVQFAGAALIQQIQAMLQYQKSFGNMGICMLQIAKSLLCRPEQSLITISGSLTISEFNSVLAR